MIRSNTEAAFHQSLDRLIACPARADQLDHFIDITNCIDQALDPVRFLLCLVQAVGGTPTDHIDAVLDIKVD